MRSTTLTRRGIRTWLVLALASAGIFASLVPAARAQGTGAGASRQWAILIGVEKYETAPALRFTCNDVVQIAQTLNARGGFASSDILQVTDVGGDPDRQPTKAQLMKLLPEWLQKPGPNDKLIVYFS